MPRKYKKRSHRRRKVYGGYRRKYKRVVKHVRKRVYGGYRKVRRVVRKRIYKHKIYGGKLSKSELRMVRLAALAKARMARLRHLRRGGFLPALASGALAAHNALRVIKPLTLLGDAAKAAGYDKKIEAVVDRLPGGRILKGLYNFGRNQLGYGRRRRIARKHLVRGHYRYMPLHYGGSRMLKRVHVRGHYARLP